MSGRRAAGTALLLALGAGALAAAGLARTQEAAVVPADQTALLERAARDRIKGDSAAAMRIVEVSDFQCPFCAQHHRENMRAIDSLYIRTGKARYLWIGFPNPTHPRAWPAIEAAFCAGGAGRFWPMHDVLFERQDEWVAAPDPNALFVAYAREIGIDGASFSECLRNDRTAPLQVSDYESAIRSGIESTPFFVIGDSLAIRGAVGLSDFRSAVDSLLALRGIPLP
ncbi:MAG: DsbA family protein [Gemmatimonadota bacterium]